MDLAYAMGSQGAGGGQAGGMLYVSSAHPSVCGLLFSSYQTAAEKGETAQDVHGEPEEGRYSCHFGGLYGKITGITDEAITLEIAEKVRVKVSKSAVADYVKGEQA